MFLNSFARLVSPDRKRTANPSFIVRRRYRELPDIGGAVSPAIAAPLPDDTLEAPRTLRLFGRLRLPRWPAKPITAVPLPDEQPVARPPVPRRRSWAAQTMTRLSRPFTLRRHRSEDLQPLLEPNLCLSSSSLLDDVPIPDPSLGDFLVYLDGLDQELEGAQAIFAAHTMDVDAFEDDERDEDAQNSFEDSSSSSYSSSGERTLAIEFRDPIDDEAHSSNPFDDMERVQLSDGPVPECTGSTQLNPNCTEFYFPTRNYGSIREIEAVTREVVLDNPRPPLPPRPSIGRRLSSRVGVWRPCRPRQGTLEALLEEEGPTQEQSIEVDQYPDRTVVRLSWRDAPAQSMPPENWEEVRSIDYAPTVVPVHDIHC
ncbi:hypothetical protein BDZ90DRAFT_261047 [Jaminaea rosea]|uniref:Uncharacterized protein n=1 Tax=Jaminaea rosea TaxID=1569628 RepID=A0A316UP98_9BASI|nr:hypothetical protein BDZ90DRAFT_261047 [Jaminaea rosea]PWN26794.1 hypothetical protein BDZ90DRAFT_261047 [Jaminaea rosea]